MPPKRTWFVIADASRARVFAQEAPGGALSERPERSLDDPDGQLRSRELGDDRPGMNTSGPAGTAHRFDPPTDPHDHEMDLFADRVASAIDEGARKGDFDRLVLVSAPKFLGRLRKRIGDGAASRLDGSLDRDLTRFPTAEIAAHLVDAELMRVRQKPAPAGPAPRAAAAKRPRAAIARRRGSGRRPSRRS